MIVLATIAPETTAVVMSCALRDSVALDIQDDISARTVRNEEVRPGIITKPSI